jgi:hypothetical protein
VEPEACFIAWKPFSVGGGLIRLSGLTIRSEFLPKIVEAQKLDDQYAKFLALAEPADSSFRVSEDGSVHMRDRLWVPSNPELKREILDEAHMSRYTIHPGGTKMFKDLQRKYW